MNEKLYHILVIDDDTRLRNLLEKYLNDNGFHVEAVKNTFEAKAAMENSSFNILIVDVMLPGENGIEFTKWVRSNSKIPILMLTAMGESGSRIEGLEAGADDYLAKPFEPKELLLRINNIMKRNGNVTVEKDESICKFGDFIFNFSDLRLKKNNEYLHITESEAKILTILCKELGTPISREKLSTLCGNIDFRSIDVQITRLRRKIETNPKQPHFLHTIRNFGYVLRN